MGHPATTFLTYSNKHGTGKCERTTTTTTTTPTALVSSISSTTFASHSLKNKSIPHQSSEFEKTRQGRSSSLSSTRRLLWWSAVVLTVTSIFFSSCLGEVEGKHAWERPGCHKVGHTRKVQIPECVEFTITTNACRGYCESFAVPSAWYRLQNNPSQAITSVGQCCNIMETEDVTVSVMCMDGQKELVFKSAKSCACYHCKKD